MAYSPCVGGSKKKILILLSDTGGGHRASAGALSDALKDIYGDRIEIEICDIWTSYSSWPYNSFVSVYRFASENPWCWKLLYESTTSPIARSLFLSAAYFVSFPKFTKFLKSLQPDLIISVHPLCQHVPIHTIKRIKQEDPDYKVPAFVTIVTDLGGAHPTWFHQEIDRLYIPTDNLHSLAIKEGVPPERIRTFGLPLRREFWRVPNKSKESLRESLGLKPTWNSCLLVGGGEGVGGIEDIAFNIAKTFLMSDEQVRDLLKQYDATLATDTQNIGQSDLQLIIVTGKSEKTRTRVLTSLHQLATQNPGRIIVTDRSTTYLGPGAVGARPRAMSDQYKPVSGRLRRVRTGSDDVSIKRSFLESHDSLKAMNEHEFQNFMSLPDHTKSSPSTKAGAESPRQDASIRGDGTSIPGDGTSILGDEISTPGDGTGNCVEGRRSPGEGTRGVGEGTRGVGEVSSGIASGITAETETESSEFEETRLHCVVYGFSREIDQLMSASDILISKAGPGTIAEATTRGLPIILSSYLPGQEEGNVGFVLSNQFGCFCQKGLMIGAILRQWLGCEDYSVTVRNMSVRSLQISNPTASLDIASDLTTFLS